jgi:hypothetical protein
VVHGAAPVHNVAVPVGHAGPRAQAGHVEEFAHGEGFQGEGFKGEGFQGEDFKGEGYKDEGFKGEGFKGEGFKGEGFKGHGEGKVEGPKGGKVEGPKGGKAEGKAEPKGNNNNNNNGHQQENKGEKVIPVIPVEGSAWTTRGLTGTSVVAIVGSIVAALAL